MEPIVAFQAEVINRLKGVMERGCLGHAYLLVGDEGSSGERLAHAFSQTLLCTNLSDGWACGECPSCRKFATSNHPDFFLLASGERYIKIDQIRELKRQSALNPFEGGRRVILLEQAERMNLEATNAFLKLLEEPPPSTIILMATTKPTMLQATIRSRMLRLNLKHPSMEAIVEQLQSEGVERDTALESARSARGNLELARKLSIPDEAPRVDVAQMETFLGKLGTVQSAVDFAQEWGKDRLMVLERLDALAYYMGSTLGEDDRSDDLGLERALEEVMFAKTAISANASVELCLTNLFIRLGDLGVHHIYR